MMRRSFWAVAAMFVGLMIPSSGVWAASVLLPQSGQNDASLFGLVPQGKGGSVAPNPALEENAPQQTFIPQDQPSFLPQTPTYSNGNAGGAYGMTPAQQAEFAAAGEETRSKPRIIIERMDDLVAGPGNMVLSMAVAANNRWGREDIKLLAKYFGYSPAQISSGCLVRLTTLLRAENNPAAYGLRLGAGQAGQILYAGIPTKIEVKPMAVCTPPAGGLPRNGGAYWQVGSYLAVSLGRSARCPLPMTPNATLSMRYEGDSSVRCDYGN